MSLSIVTSEYKVASTDDNSDTCPVAPMLLQVLGALPVGFSEVNIDVVAFRNFGMKFSADTVSAHQLSRG